MNPIIKIQSITKAFDSKEILKGITLNVGKGNILAIIGPSGSGKTTLLRCLNYLTKIDQGKIIIENFLIDPRPPKFNVHDLRKKVGMVFQNYNLWPHKTVLENMIEAPILVSGLKKREAIEKAEIILDRIRLLNKAGDYPLKLSGGQQQRVAIARAVAMDPQILLLDEITSALDRELVWEVQAMVKEIVADRTRTIILVTHELGFAKEIADKIVFIENGKIIEQGPPDKIFNNPVHSRTKKFIERSLQYYK